jgi:glycosyltransferase involved in cell wall biosynthesis
MKICVVSPLFAIAGVPLAQLRFARALARAGHEVDLILGKLNDGLPPPSASGVNVVVLNRPNVRSMFLPLFRYLRCMRPDVVFSAEDHLNVVVLLAAMAARSRAKISGSSRVTPFDTYSDVLFSKRWVLKHLARILMSRADALTCVSEDMVGQYRAVFRRSPHICVYNIVSDDLSKIRMAEPADDPWLSNKTSPLLIAAGRLATWKGFEDLIRGMAIVAARRAVRLMILGDGPLRRDLEALIGDLRLTEYVRLTGYVENPLKYFSRADVFVLSSHVEGLPNVLVEAMMCGCTPVATDCPTGPREVLRDGKYGYLVPVRNPPALADGILQALDRPIPRVLLSEAVRPFEESAVLARHFEVLGITHGERAGALSCA